MTLFLSDMLHEFDARLFFDYEGYGENLLVLTVPNNDGDVITTMAEFHDEMVTFSAMVMEMEEEFYLTAVEVCNMLNAGARWNKHFVQETPEGKLQLCVAADFVARELMSDRCFDLMMDFINHTYDVKAYIMQAE